jgi:hypothetical protein
MLATEKIAKNRKIFECTTCDYKTCNKFDYTKHVDTIKHKNAILATKNRDLATESSDFATQQSLKVSKQKPRIYSCCNCDKVYVDKTGLWRHKKKCDPLNNESDPNEGLHTENTTEQPDTNKPTVDPTIVTMLMEEVRKIITDQNKTLLEVVKVTGNNSHNTTTNNNNSHNKTFNLQIFLNETCKDAMNIMDFVDQIVLTLSDLEETGRIGFAEGISKMIMKRLQKLDVTERPIHCSDLKRETLYIKNQNKWEKEEDGKPVLTNAVKQIAGKNMMQIFDWQKAHPDYNDPETRTSDKYMKMITNVMSGGTEEEINENYEKIIRNLIKEATINKEKFMV